MKTIVTTVLVILFGTSLAFSQCPADRHFLDISFLGNESYQIGEYSGITNATGVAVRYGKSTFNGFSYAVGVTNRNTTITLDRGFLQSSRQSLSFELKQELVNIGRFSLAPTGSVYLGRMMWNSMGDAGSGGTENYSSTMLGAAAGLEANYHLICFLDVFGRSTVAFEKGMKDSDFYATEYFQARPISQIGLRFSI